MVNLFLQIVSSYYIYIVLFLLAAGASLYGYKSGNYAFVKQMVLVLVVEAEKQLGSGTGELKYVTVVEKLYSKMPAILRLLYSKQQIDSLIEDAVEYLKRYLANGKNLLSYDSERVK